MTLSILIVNYNGSRDLPTCLESVRRLAPEGTEVIVCDNGSTDGSDRLVEQDFPWVRLVRAGGNVGFAAGNNVAGRLARGEFVLLLNPDTLLIQDIAPAVSAMRADPRIGALTIRSIDGAGNYQQCIALFPTPRRLVRLSTLFPEGAARWSATVEVDWVQGSFLLTRRCHWDELGGLDERYFMYGEDMDYCRRIRDLGLKVVYLPGIQYVHYGGFNRHRLAELMNGMRRYVDAHFAGAEWALGRGVLLGTSVLRLLRAVAVAGTRPSADNATFVKVAANACWRVVA